MKASRPSLKSADQSGSTANSRRAANEHPGRFGALQQENLLVSIANQLESDFGTLSELIHSHAMQQPAHPALTLDGVTLDYAALDERLDRMAVSLQREGMGIGDVIAIAATTSLEYAVAFLGSLRAGVAVAPLAPDMTPANLVRMLADSNAKLLFLDNEVAGSLQPLADEVRARKIALDDSSAGTRWSTWLAAPGARPLPVEVQPDTPFNIIYSSGTTGAPKGIVLPHSFRWAQFKLFQGLGYGPDSVVMVTMPLYSNMTLSSFLPPLSMGSSILLMSKFDAGRYLALAEKHRVTHSMMVPVQFQRIMARADFEQFDLSSFRVKSCGSAHFPSALKADVLARWPGDLVEYYGMTEGGGVTVLDARRHADKLHTVGHPVAGHDMRVIDPQGRELPRGSTGEIVARSPTMMTGYHNLAEKTRDVQWFDLSAQRFIRTGDVGYFDEDGFLVLLDRTKDMIISGGFNIFPSDLEGVLRGHPDIVEAAVTGVPSQRWGETPVAFVIRRSGSGLTAAQLMDWSQARLNKAQRLAAVDFVDDLPRNGIGKVLKRTLRDTWLASGRSL